MRSRLAILWIIAVVLPLALLGWLGRLHWQSEVNRWQESEQVRAADELLLMQRSLGEFVDALARPLFADLLRLDHANEATLAGEVSKQPLVRQAFVLGQDGRLLYPDPEKQEVLSDEERGFIRRTVSIWNRGEKLGSAITAKSEKAMSSANDPTSGWHVWYHEDGPHWLCWQRRLDGRQSGFEIERMAFLGRLAGGFKPGSISRTVRLVSGDENVLWQQGEWTLNARPLASLPCASPLQHWHWEAQVGAVDSPRPSWLPYGLGYGGVAALLAALGVVLVLMYQRDLREASQRVSFVNQVSHELKTPLTNIRLYLDLARDSAGTEANAMLDVVEEEASRLSRMIQNVLTFARHERETLSLHPVTGDLAAVVVRVVEHWRPLLSRRGLVVSFDPSAQMVATFDADAVEQILGNLLSNVEKYATPATRVAISLTRHESRAEIRVQDDGPGISTKDAERIFDDFFRSRSDVTEGVSGTGLGLSIARSLARAQDGTLELVKSAAGACFVLRLPLKNTDSPVTS